MKDSLLNFRYIFSLLVIASMSFSTQASAADRWFEVELLVFKRNVDVQDISEQLDQNNVYLKQRERLEVFKAKQVTDCLANKPCLHEKNPVQIGNSEIVRGGHRLQRLDASHLQLSKQREKLSKHQLFDPIMHVAWRMPVQNKQKALPIHLFAGENYALALHKEALLEQGENPELTYEPINTELNPLNTTDVNIDQISSIDATKLDVLAALQKPQSIQDLYEIDGNLLIYVERYLFVDSQLIVRTETEKEISSVQSVLAGTDLELEDAEVTDETAAEVVAQELIVQETVDTETVVTETLFDQNRRLRSEEIHYLDHPLFGIIIQIRKIPEDQLPK